MNVSRLFVDAYFLMPEPRVKLFPSATHLYSAMLDACFVITALMKQPENNFQLTGDRWKFNFRPNQHLSNKGIKQTINFRRIVLIGYWRVKKKKKVIARDQQLEFFFFLQSSSI